MGKPMQATHEAHAVAAITATGQGLPLWEHLEPCHGSMAAFRAACREWRQLSYPLITFISHLVLGADDDNTTTDFSASRENSHPQREEHNVCPQTEETQEILCRVQPHKLQSFSDEPISWCPSQLKQQGEVKSLLRRLTHLKRATVVISTGGTSQLAQLLEQSCFAACLRELKLQTR